MQKARMIRINRWNRDRPGGHQETDLKDYIKGQWPDELHGAKRKSCKNEDRRQQRRKCKHITAEALHDYLRSITI